MPREGPPYFPAQPSLQVSAEKLLSPDTAHLFRIANTCALENQASQSLASRAPPPAPAASILRGGRSSRTPLEASQKPEGSMIRALNEGRAPHTPEHLGRKPQQCGPFPHDGASHQGLKKKIIISGPGGLVNSISLRRKQIS